MLRDGSARAAVAPSVGSRSLPGTNQGRSLPVTNQKSVRAGSHTLGEQLSRQRQLVERDTADLKHQPYGRKVHELKRKDEEILEEKRSRLRQALTEIFAAADKDGSGSLENSQ